jgi:putative addiction module killer protein
MYTIVESGDFEEMALGAERWCHPDPARVRLDKARRGNLGDVKPVGGGVFEMREFFGPGWRMDYLEQAGTIIFRLGGGDKPSQASDIERAKRMAQELRNEQDQDPSV